MRKPLITVALGSLLFLTCAAAWAAAVGERMAIREEAAAMLADLPAAAEQLPLQSPAREAIEAGDYDKARAMLSFQPIAEAPLPKGFPPYTPVGLIEVKEYPAYRKAVGANFWTLFNHIQKQGIPMTAPVEMAGARDAADGRGEMAFLYQNTSVGQQGPIDGVEVEDAAPAMVVSIGVRGVLDAKRAGECRERLEAWLDDSQQYQVAAKVEEPFRIFGFNGPMISSKDRFWEAQILIEPKQ